jgi:hypothetical protein
MQASKALVIPKMEVIVLRLKVLFFETVGNGFG